MLASNRQSDKYLKIAPMSTTNARNSYKTLLATEEDSPRDTELARLPIGSQEPQIMPTSSRVNSNINRFPIEVIN